MSSPRRQRAQVAAQALAGAASGQVVEHPEAAGAADGEQAGGPHPGRQPAGARASAAAAPAASAGPSSRVIGSPRWLRRATSLAARRAAAAAARVRRVRRERHRPRPPSRPANARSISRCRTTPSTAAQSVPVRSGAARRSGAATWRRGQRRLGAVAEAVAARDLPSCCSRSANTVVMSPIGVPPVSTVETAAGELLSSARTRRDHAAATPRTSRPDHDRARRARVEGPAPGSSQVERRVGGRWTSRSARLTLDGLLDAGGEHDGLVARPGMSPLTSISPASGQAVEEGLRRSRRSARWPQLAGDHGPGEQGGRGGVTGRVAAGAGAPGVCRCRDGVPEARGEDPADDAPGCRRRPTATRWRTRAVVLATATPPSARRPVAGGAASTGSAQASWMSMRPVTLAPAR